MTISNTQVLAEYSGNGVTTSFAIPQSFQSNSQIVVVLVADDGVTETTQTLTTHYSFVGSPATSITMVTAPASGETLLIKRSTPLTQTADYLGNGAFKAASHEAALDKIVQMIQELNHELRRIPKFLLSDTDSLDLQYPGATERAGKYAAYDGDGAPIATSGPITPASTTTYIDTLLDDTTAAQARATLGFSGPSGQVATANIAGEAVTYAKIQQVSATDMLLGRSTAGAGVVEEIPCTAAGRALINDADATAQRTTLGLGTIATQAADAVAITGGSVVTKETAKAKVVFNGVQSTGTYTRTGTQVYMSVTGHGLIEGQKVNLDFTSGSATDGTYTVDEVIGLDNFTVIDSVSGSTSGNVTIHNKILVGMEYVSSVTDVGTGDYRVNWASSIPYPHGIWLTCQSVDATSLIASLSNSEAPTATTCRIKVENDASTATDASYVAVLVFGD